MPKIMRQTIRNRGVSYLKVTALLVVTVFLMNLSIGLLTDVSPVLASIVAVVIVGIGVALVYNIVFYDLANYIYKIIGRELIIERIISRNNHLFYNIAFGDILIFRPYTQFDRHLKVPRSLRFVQTREKDQWYYLEYNHRGNKRGLVFEPEMGLVKSINERLKEYEIE